MCVNWSPGELSGELGILGSHNNRGQSRCDAGCGDSRRLEHQYLQDLGTQPGGQGPSGIPQIEAIAFIPQYTPSDDVPDSMTSNGGPETQRM